MSVEMKNELTGKPVLAQDGYEIYGTYVEGQLIVTGVYASDPEPLQEVRIPPIIGGAKVRAIAGHFCGNEWEVFSIGTLHIPDCVGKVNLIMMKPAQLLLTPTDTPALRLVNGLLLSGDGRTVLTYADASLTRYVVPEGVEEIGVKAFCYCRAEEIVLPQSLRAIGECAFYATRMRQIDLPASVRKIEKSAFERSRLEAVVLPQGLERLGECAFSQCELRTVRVPGTVKWITWEAFSACLQLTEAALEQGVQVIGSYAFEGCSALKKVTLPQGLEKICDGAFRDCGCLSDVPLPQSVVSVGKDAFTNRGFTIAGEDEAVKPWQKEEFAGQVVHETPEMTICARREGDALIITGVWHVRAGEPPVIRIPAEIGGLPVTGLQEDCVADLGGWLSCQTLYLPDSLSIRSIPGDFSYAQLELVPTRQPLMRMEKGCILSMDGKRLLAPSDRQAYVCTVPEGVEEIADRAFVGSSVRVIRLPQTLREIGNNAFDNAALRRLTLPQGIRRIGAAAFAETLLEDVALPEGLEALGDEAFAGSLLCTLHLPDSLREVGVDVVKACWRLERVRLPEGMAQLPASPEEAPESCEEDMMTEADDMDFLFSDSVPVLETEGYTVYGSASGRTATGDSMQIDTVKTRDEAYVAEVRIPVSAAGCVVEVVGNGWIAPKVRIGRLLLPGSVCRIDQQWLACVDELVMESGEEAAYVIENGFLLTRDRKTLMQQLRWQDAQVCVPEGVEEIAAGAFSACLVEEITFPASVERMGERAFEASALRQINLPEGLRTLGCRAFASCRQLREVRLNSILQELPEDAFQDCVALECVALPLGLEKIGNGAFRGCRALAALTLPETLRCLGHDALMDTGLTALHMPAALTQVHMLAIRGLNLTVAQEHPLFMAQHGVLYSKDGETLLRWNDTEEAIVPEHVKRVAAHAFSNCRGLKRVVLPWGLTELEQFAFSDCSSLECMALPEGMKRIGAGCFDNCRSLKEIRLPDGLEEIGQGCFSTCLGLERLCVPQSVQHIGKQAFVRCRLLRELMLPDDLVRQEDGAYLKVTGAAQNQKGGV